MNRMEESQLADYDSLGPGEAPVFDDDDASKRLYIVELLAKEQAEIEQLAINRIRDLMIWMEHQCRGRQRQIDFLSRQLEAYVRVRLEGRKKQSLSLPDGTLKLMMPQPALEIDEEAFFGAKPDEALVAVIPEQKRPDRNAIKAHIRQTGEIPEGCEWTEPTERAFHLRVGPDGGEKLWQENVEKWGALVKQLLESRLTLGMEEPSVKP